MERIGRDVPSGITVSEMTDQCNRRPSSEWIEHRRADDDELVGFLVPDGDQFVPVTVFGYPIAQSAPRGESEGELDRRGLSYLAERWVLRLPDQTSIQVEIAEASPAQVVVQSVDLFSGLDYGTRFTLHAPVDGRLTLS
jgi:hypothetical protein